MNRQLIIKAPEDASIEVINGIQDRVSKFIMTNLPIVLPHDWTYEVVEISSPAMVIKE